MPSDEDPGARENEKHVKQKNTTSDNSPPKPDGWARFFRKPTASSKSKSKPSPDSTDVEDEKSTPEKWSLGILNDRETDEVPGSVLLMSKQFKRNEPLGLRHTPARHSSSSLPSPILPPDERPASGSTSKPAQSPSTHPQTQAPASRTPRSARPVFRRMFSTLSEKSVQPEKKKTKDGKIILEPQPDDSLNDPLNWPAWRRDVALLSLGLYCAMGGGMTPVLAAGFNNVAASYGVSVPTVSLTTGFYMLGLGFGSVFASPTAILYGKRPVYIFGALMFIASSIWCAYSPNYASLVVARIFMGFSISPIECLPSATIAEIFYLHERAYRLGIYTLLLLGGKNLIPLISAAIIGGLDWQWVFKIVAMIAGLCVVFIFFFVPETFWDRTPRPKKHVRKHTLGSFSHLFTSHHQNHSKQQAAPKGLDGSTVLPRQDLNLKDVAAAGTIAQRRQRTQHHVGFADAADQPVASPEPYDDAQDETSTDEATKAPSIMERDETAEPEEPKEEAAIEKGEPSAEHKNETGEKSGNEAEAVEVKAAANPQDNVEEPTSAKPVIEDHNLPYFMSKSGHANVHDVESGKHLPGHEEQFHAVMTPIGHHSGTSTPTGSSIHHTYTQHLRVSPPKSYRDTLKPWNGRLKRDNWFKCAMRPFILFAYPAILWSTLIYSLSIGWLIVISESVSVIYREKDTYNFTALQAGLVYISPFVGGVLGTAVAGKVSDVIVRFMARRNNGIYEPEFRLVMGFPILLSTAIGLMGFGWSAQIHDNYMAPTIMFGIVSFGCSLGSTTAITFAVDSYRQYAGEALVTLNFSKNVLHGFVFSLFFTTWLTDDGGKSVFLVIGGIQILCLLTTIPMYIYGKRMRMWTVRKNMMERF